MIATDVDGDGWPDVVTACDLSDGEPKHISHPRVYRNLGSSAGSWPGLRFESARIPTVPHVATSQPLDPRFTAVAAGDTDLDGDVDLYFVDQDIDPGLSGPPQPEIVDSDDRRFVTDGFGFYAGSTSAAFAPAMLQSTFGNSAQLAEINGDGLPDRLRQDGYQNTGTRIAYGNRSGGFAPEVTVSTSLTYYASASDLDADGRIDLVVTSNGPDFLMKNQGNGPGGLAGFSGEIPFDFLAGGDRGFGSNHVTVDADGDGRLDSLIPDVDPEIPGIDRRSRSPGGRPAVGVRAGGRRRRHGVVPEQRRTHRLHALTAASVSRRFRPAGPRTRPDLRKSPDPGPRAGGRR